MPVSQLPKGQSPEAITSKTEGPSGTKYSGKAAAWENTIPPVTLNHTGFLHDSATPSRYILMNCPGRTALRSIVPARPGTAANCCCQKVIVNDPRPEPLLTSRVKTLVGDLAGTPLPAVSHSTLTTRQERTFAIRT